MRYLVLFFIFISLVSKANDGDSVKMAFHTAKDFKCSGGGERINVWTAFNPGTKKYRKAYLKITLGCGSVECCVWDYLFNTFVMKKPGGLDSSIAKYDTISYDAITKNKYKYTDSVFVKIDTIKLVPLTIDSVFKFTDSLFVKLDTIGKINIIRKPIFKFFDKVDDYEIGRLITPYGYNNTGIAGMSKNAATKHPYLYDITDYLPLIKDSFGLGIITGGWDNAPRAFNVTSEIILIEGESAKMPKEVKRVYFKSYQHSTSAQFDTATKPMTFMVGNDVEAVKFRATITGHGGHGEFTPHTYYVLVNGAQKYERKLWRTDCDQVAVAPQGGTWIFSRANWCPGDGVEADEWDLTPYMTKGQNLTVDVNMEEFDLAAGEEANYQIFADVITYTSNKKKDASIVDIISPNKDKRFSPANPICSGPVVRIKNEGKDVLKKLYIDYWVDPANKSTFIWNGNLESSKSEIVNLPAIPWTGLIIDTPKFYVQLQMSSHNTDDASNDYRMTDFVVPPVYSGTLFKLDFRTSNNGAENEYVVKNEIGAVVYSKKNLTANTNYSEVMTLPDGCYTMEFTDYDPNLECGDGLSFWWSSQTQGKTAGNISFKNSAGTVLKNFNPDFGRKIVHQFTTNSQKLTDYSPLSTYKYFNSGIDKAEESLDNILIFPNPTSEFVNIKTETKNNAFLSVKNIFGSIVFIKKFETTSIDETIDTRDFCSGVYFLEIADGQKIMIRKIVVE
jgi:hypothetical protein